MLLNRQVYNYCLHMLCDRESAEDTTQEVFVQVLKDIKDLRSVEKFRAWLFQIARHQVLMTLRRRRIESHEELNEGIWENETPLEITSRVEAQEHIQQAIAQLKHEYREVLHLREFEQLSYAEIAFATGATESSVRSRLFKARKALFQKLAPLSK